MRHKAKWLLFRFMCFACIIVGLFMLVGLKNAVTSLEYELAELNVEKVALLRSNKHLTGQRASIYSAETIEAFATERLGMKIPDRENIILVKRTAAAGPRKVSLGSGQRSGSGWE
jgi:cell division protein FtsL